MHIFIDDERQPWNVLWMELPSASWYVVRSYNEFVSLLGSITKITHVSFDHDLADAHYGHGLNDDEITHDSYKEKTGKHCAQALVDWCLDNDRPLPTYTVHSLNPVGRKNITDLLDSFKDFRS